VQPSLHAHCRAVDWFLTRNGKISCTNSIDEAAAETTRELSPNACWLLPDCCCSRTLTVTGPTAQDCGFENTVAWLLRQEVRLCESIDCYWRMLSRNVGYIYDF
jgi:hypothetical protein